MAQHYACKGWRTLGSQLVLERLDNSLDLLVPGASRTMPSQVCGSGQNESCCPSMASPSWNHYTRKRYLVYMNFKGSTRAC